MSSPDGALSAAEVHAAYEHFRRQGDQSAILTVVSDYLAHPLPPEEERWARWERADCLALLGRCEEVMAFQQADLAWTTEHFSIEARLRVMDDSTQAACWLVSGRLDDWLTIFQRLMADTEPTEGNRFERFYYLRTACHLLQESDRQEEAYALVSRIRALITEDPGWARASEMEIQALDCEMRLFGSQRDIPRLRQAGVAATQRLEQQSNKQQIEKQSLQTGCNNIAGTLFRATQYDLSIPLHRRCLELGSRSEYVRLWLAAALWQTERHREETLSLLRQGAAERWGDGYPELFAALSEFADVQSDPEFIAAVTGGPV